METLELELYNGRKISFDFRGIKHEINDIPLIQFSYKFYTAKIADMEFSLSLVDTSSLWYGSIKTKYGLIVNSSDKSSAQETLTDLLEKFNNKVKTKEGYYKFFVEEEKSKNNV